MITRGGGHWEAGEAIGRATQDYTTKNKVRSTLGGAIPGTGRGLCAGVGELSGRGGTSTSALGPRVRLLRAAILGLFAVRNRFSGMAVCLPTGAAGGASNRSLRFGRVAPGIHFISGAAIPRVGFRPFGPGGPIFCLFMGIVGNSGGTVFFFFGGPSPQTWGGYGCCRILGIPQKSKDGSAQSGRQI